MFVDKLFEIVEKEFGVTKEELIGNKRHQDLVIYRRILAYYLRKNGLVFYKVADIMNKDHSTIIFYTRTFDDELRYNETFSICHERVKYKIKALINESKQVSE